MSDAVDQSDVPQVTTREMALALKIYAAAGAALSSPMETAEAAIRQVEQAFWQVSPRDRVRKVAVLVRFRSLIEACGTRRMTALIQKGGQEAVFEALAAAAKLRLNTRWGFNPQKLAWAIEDTLRAAETEPVALAA